MENKKKDSSIVSTEEAAAKMERKNRGKNNMFHRKTKA